MRRAEVLPYQPAWREAFEQESRLLEEALGPVLRVTHHVGSTSVPGLSAKPIVDMLPVVSDITAVDALNPALQALGYQALGENGLPGRRFFRKPSEEERTHHLHIYQDGNPEITRHLAFREYLTAHPAAAQEYQDLKLTLAQQHPTDIEAYIQGKNDLIQRLETQALAWWQTMQSQPLLALRLRPHQDLNRELRRFTHAYHLQAACVLTCVGSLRQAVLRPANQPATVSWTDKFEIVSLTGTLSPDGLHLHIALSDGAGRTIGGHLMDGCRIYTTAEIVIARLAGWQFTRPVDPETTYDELIPAPPL